MSSGVFIGKDFSHRIELSRLVQDVLKFHSFGCYPPLWGVGGCLGGWMVWVGGGNPHAHVHAHTHTCARTCMCYKDGNFMQMAAPIGISH